MLTFITVAIFVHKFALDVRKLQFAKWKNIVFFGDAPSKEVQARNKKVFRAVFEQGAMSED